MPTDDTTRTPPDAAGARRHPPGSADAVVAMWLVPEETVAAGALQLGLWGEVGVASERAARALVRVQALLGPESVVTAVLVGGRDPAERVRLVSWGDDRAIDGAVQPASAPLPPMVTAPPATGERVWAELGPALGPDVAPAGWPVDVIARTGRTPVAAPDAVGPPTHRRRPPTPPRGTTSRTVHEPAAPWPGRLPAPSPATVPPRPLPAELHDGEREPVRLVMSDRLSAPPARLAVDGAAALTVEAWAGPWPVRQRWWIPGADESARVQVRCSGGAAFLLLARAGRWWVTGVYD